MREKLDERQRAIAELKTGPALIVSGPGSGKTRVITARAAHLAMDLTIAPQRIFVVTFTKAAADEMEGRIRQVVGSRVARQMHIQTIHSLAYKFLWRLGHRFELQDDRTQRARLLNIIMRLDLPRELVEIYLSERANCLNRLIELRDYDPNGMQKKEFQAITEEYNEQQLQAGFLDFDDLLLKMYTLLPSLPELPGRFLLVDEFQDTSLLQYEILKLLARPTNNFFAVGDDDQSIYSWRGASNIPQLFMEDFPDAEKINLTVNYRSTKQVVSLSSALIGQNQDRFAKKLKNKVEAKIGSRPRFASPKDEKAEAILVAEFLEKQQNQGVLWEEMAILYRLNSQAVLFQDELVKRQIPFRVLGGEAQILTHSVTKGLFSYLEAAMDLENREAFFYILNRPGRYVSQNCIEVAKRKNVMPLKALQEQDVGHGALQALKRLETDLKHLKKLTARGALRFVREVIGFDAHLRLIAEKYSLDFSEYEQVAETISLLPDENEAVPAFLKRVQGLDSNERVANGVTLATCHSSKGLEFKAVALVGMTEGVLPHEKAKTSKDLEEERRLAYVAVTRSQEHLLVTSPKIRLGKKVIASRFIHELQAGISREELQKGKIFKHPTWGLCTIEELTKDTVLIKKPNGEKAKLVLDWLLKQNIV